MQVDKELAGASPITSDNLSSKMGERHRRERERERKYLCVNLYHINIKDK